MPEKKISVAPVARVVCRPVGRVRRRGHAAERRAPRAGEGRSLPVDIAWPHRAVAPGQAVVPVFLPFRGCPVRCVFCAQDVQTGQGAAISFTGAPPAVNTANGERGGDAPGPRHGLAHGPAHDLAAVLDAARDNLQRRHGQGAAPAELAFYGGTFTALPETELRACLDMAREALARGWIRAFRCSTRPDRVDPAILARLRDAGCATVELGVQSFDDAALLAARRGYDGATALTACGLVRDAGLRLGVQLLPGMPGHTPEIFAADVPKALDVGADMLRFYPCLVLDGTGLAAMWREGRYAPWPLDVAMDALARGWLAAARAGVRVIRMGLAPERDLICAVLAGPADPALGARVMGRSLLLAVGEALTGLGAERPRTFDLRLPRAAQGCFWGTGGELRPAWAALGLRAVFFADAAPPELVF